MKEKMLFLAILAAFVTSGCEVSTDGDCLRGECSETIVTNTINKCSPQNLVTTIDNNVKTVYCDGVKITEIRPIIVTNTVRSVITVRECTPDDLNVTVDANGTQRIVCNNDIITEVSPIVVDHNNTIVIEHNNTVVVEHNNTIIKEVPVCTVEELNVTTDDNGTKSVYCKDDLIASIPATVTNTDSCDPVLTKFQVYMDWNADHTPQDDEIKGAQQLRSQGKEIKLILRDEDGKVAAHVYATKCAFVKLTLCKTKQYHWDVIRNNDGDPIRTGTYFYGADKGDQPADGLENEVFRPIDGTMYVRFDP